MSVLLSDLSPGRYLGIAPCAGNAGDQHDNTELSPYVSRIAPEQKSHKRAYTLLLLPLLAVFLAVALFYVQMLVPLKLAFTSALGTVVSL